MPIDGVEFADNPEPRCPVVLLVDVSSSMMEQGRLAALNDGVARFLAEVRADELAALRVELCVVTFGTTVTVHQPFTCVGDLEALTLRAGGTTAMGAGIERALDELDARKAAYKEHGVLYYRPWVFLLTDGAPTDPWQAAAERVHAGEANRKFLFYAVGVAGADFTKLARISPPERQPLQLKGLEFTAMFQWLSASVRAVSTSSIDAGGVQDLPPISGWGEAPTL